MRNACRACKDLTNIYSDISFGGLGSPEKYTTVIPRTEKGKQLFNKIRDEKIITCLELDPIKKKKMKEIIIHMSQLKIKRYEDFVKLI
jgi:coenzyme F420 hydrogenase subunit beta